MVSISATNGWPASIATEPNTTNRKRLHKIGEAEPSQAIVKLDQNHVDLAFGSHS
jgi:hypothetical protein